MAGNLVDGCGSVTATARQSQYNVDLDTELIGVLFNIPLNSAGPHQRRCDWSKTCSPSMRCVAVQKYDLVFDGSSSGRLPLTGPLFPSWFYSCHQ